MINVNMPDIGVASCLNVTYCIELKKGYRKVELFLWKSMVTMYIIWQKRGASV
jgi:hypothetical protein